MRDSINIESERPQEEEEKELREKTSLGLAKLFSEIKRQRDMKKECTVESCSCMSDSAPVTQPHASRCNKV